MRPAVLFPDLKARFAGTFLDNRLEMKFNNAATELSWQWFFPAKSLTFVPGEKAYRRYHIHETHVQKAIRAAVRKAKSVKRASAHTFRHSFASHLFAGDLPGHALYDWHSSFSCSS